MIAAKCHCDNELFVASMQKAKPRTGGKPVGAFGQLAEKALLTGCYSNEEFLKLP
jgi:hypothetical protein